MVSFLIDDDSVKKLLKSYFAFPKETKKEMNIALKRAMSDVSSKARNEHRFKTRSGTLERAVKSRIVSSVPLVGRVYIDRGQAPYGRRIHEGYGSWVADRFLKKAGENSKSRIRRHFRLGMSRAIKRAGL